MCTSTVLSARAPGEAPSSWDHQLAGSVSASEGGAHVRGGWRCSPLSLAFPSGGLPTGRLQWPGGQPRRDPWGQHRPDPTRLAASCDVSSFLASGLQKYPDPQRSRGSFPRQQRVQPALRPRVLSFRMDTTRPEPPTMAPCPRRRSTGGPKMKTP